MGLGLEGTGAFFSGFSDRRSSAAIEVGGGGEGEDISLIFLCAESSFFVSPASSLFLCMGLGCFSDDPFCNTTGRERVGEGDGLGEENLCRGIPDEACEFLLASVTERGRVGDGDGLGVCLGDGDGDGDGLSVCLGVGDGDGDGDGLDLGDGETEGDGDDLGEWYAAFCTDLVGKSLSEGCLSRTVGGGGGGGGGGGCLEGGTWSL